MSDVDFKDSGVPEVTRYEHDRKNIGAKKVSLLGYDATSDVLRRLGAMDNGDGTYGMSSQSPALAVIIDDTTTPDTTYIGKAAIGSATSSAIWQVTKLDTSSGLTKTWADGNSAFDNVWDNRASLTYN